MIPALLILLGALLIPGFINKTRALLAGRKGVRFFQPLITAGVLLRKGSVYSTSATALTRIAPSLYLASVAVAALFLPLGTYPALLGFEGDIILFSYLLGLSKLALVLTALESGSPFQGMGSAREVLFGMLLEPCFFLLVGTLALVTGFYSFTSIFACFDNFSADLLVLSVVLGYAFFQVALAENGRLPLDDPRTHLELTMVHEAMILDLSGVDLAYVYAAGWIKQALYGLLVANVILPPHLAGWSLVGWFAGVMVFYAVAVGAVESLRPRNRMTKNIVYLATVAAIGLLGLIAAYILTMQVI